jgi:hypothetical protein
MKFVLGMKDSDPVGILDTIFGAINIFEGQTTDTDVFEFTDFGKIDSEGSVGIFFSQETCVFTPFRSHKRSQVQGSEFRFQCSGFRKQKPDGRRQMVKTEG